MNLNFDYDVTSIKYIKIPYNATDLNFDIAAPTIDQFNAALSNPAYTSTDLYEYDPTTGTASVNVNNIDPLTSNPDGVTTTSVDVPITSVDNNCRVWVLVQTHAYNQTLPTISVFTADNFYTPMNLYEKGVDSADTAKVLYNNQMLVVKANPSLQTGESATTYGAPLDANGNIIQQITATVTTTTDPGTGAVTGGTTVYTDAKGNPVTLIIKDKAGAFIPVKSTVATISTAAGAKAGTTDVTTTVKDAASGSVLYTTVETYNTDAAGWTNNLVAGASIVEGNPTYGYDQVKVTAEAVSGYALSSGQTTPVTYTLNPAYVASPPGGGAAGDALAGVATVANPTPTAAQVAAAKAANTTTFLYDKIADTVTLYYNPEPAVEQPQMGYFSLLDTAKNTYPLTGNSGLDDPSTPYAKYVLLRPDDGKFTLTDVIPQYYKYIGWFASPKGSITDGKYSTATSGFAMGADKNGQIPLTFAAVGDEMWVTVYIQPTTSTVTNYQWSYATNNVGTVNP